MQTLLNLISNVGRLSSTRMLRARLPVVCVVQRIDDEAVPWGARYRDAPGVLRQLFGSGTTPSEAEANLREDTRFCWRVHVQERRGPETEDSRILREWLMERFEEVEV